jgi:tRNA (pseudouridine54-N1)-methyltransferase
MRQFLVVGHDAPTDPEFSLDDLPGAGRLDALCRAVTAALLLSHDIRADVRCSVVLGDAFTIHFEGSALQGLNPDERSTAALFRTALAEREEAIGHVPVETSPGVSLVRKGFEATLADASEARTVVHLDGEGAPAVEMEPPESAVFVLSDHQPFTDAERDLLAETADRRVSLGPRRLHGSQAITVAHNWLDTDGFQEY